MTVTFAADRDVDDQPACFVCGCTDDVACPGGCAWTHDREADGLDVCTTCVVTRDLLLLVERPVTLEQLSGWTGPERDAARAWAAATHLAASDNPVRVPAEPAFLGGLGG